MAAAAAALLRSVGRKLARAPPPHPLARGLRDGGSLPPPTSDQDVIENLRVRLKFAKFLASAAGTGVVYLYFWALPEAKAQAYSRGKNSNRDDNLTNAINKIESVLVQDVEIMQSSGTHSGHGGTRVDKSEVDQVLKSFPVMMKEIAAGIKDVEANVNATEASIKHRQAAAAATELTAALKSALSEGERKE